MNNNVNNINISTSTLLRVLLIGFLVFFTIKIINIVLIILTSIVIASFVESGVIKLKNILKIVFFQYF